MASQISKHEAAHAVVAVYLGLSFGRVLIKSTCTEIARDQYKVEPPGVTNLTGSSLEMRVTALAGCMIDVIDSWTQLVEAQKRLNRPEVTKFDLVRKFMRNKYGMDLETYHHNQDVETEDIEDADLILAEKYVTCVLAKIEEVAEQLETSIQLSRRQIEEICNFKSSA